MKMSKKELYAFRKGKIIYSEPLSNTAMTIPENASKNNPNPKWHECDICRGTGRIDDTHCENCKGSGWLD